MKKIGIYFGSSTGNTEDIAKTIGQKLNTEAVHDVAKTTPDFSGYDVLILGTSTWGIGDLQDDWEDFAAKIQKADISGKKIALFGCGDSSSYSDSFCDGMGKIYNALQNKGCTFIGKIPTNGYFFQSSEAVVDGVFVGLALDVDNESNQTEARINSWIEQLLSEI